MNTNGNNEGYDAKRDSYYNKKTGEWLEPICGSPDTCEFCNKRPKKHYIKKKKKS